MKKSLSGLNTREEFAKAYDIPLQKMTYILYKQNPNCYYTTFTIPKKYGGEREINAPFGELRDIQRKIAKKLYKYYYEELNIKTNIAHAFIKEKSFITNAEIHKNKRLIINLDLQDFYPSINFGRVRGFFEKNKNFLYSRDVATIMAQLTCYKGCLPQGACTSPIISNLIASILDQRILLISKRYKCNYSRYADDLTFSSNNTMFYEQKDRFLEEIKSEIENFGCKVNDLKTNIQNKESRQIVTGIVVNKKLNINAIYYKETRAMIENLYKNKEIFIDGQVGTISQLEGRLSYINQLSKFNNNGDKTGAKHNFYNLSAREIQYQKFLVYKYFFNSDSPIIVTEGKTDIAYIKAALMNLVDKYPNLVKKKNDKFIFNIKFLKRTRRLEYFLNISKDGADALKSIYQFYTGENRHINYYKKYSQHCMSEFPVILMFDNETKSKDKPLKKFIDSMGAQKVILKDIDKQQKKQLLKDSNLYLLTHKLAKDQDESEIEDLFDKKTLDVEINGKTFNRCTTKNNNDKFFSKEIFSKYVLENYKTINFDGFRAILDNITNIINETKSRYDKNKQ